MIHIILTIHSCIHSFSFTIFYIHLRIHFFIIIYVCHCLLNKRLFDKDRPRGQLEIITNEPELQKV